MTTMIALLFHSFVKKWLHTFLLSFNSIPQLSHQVHLIHGIFENEPAKKLIIPVMHNGILALVDFPR